MGSRGDLDVLEETETSCPYRDSKPGSSSPYSKKQDDVIGMNLSMLQFHIRRNFDGTVNKRSQTRSLQVKKEKKWEGPNGECSRKRSWTKLVLGLIFPLESTSDASDKRPRIQVQFLCF